MQRRIDDQPPVMVLRSCCIAEPAALQAIVNRADWQSLDRAAVVARPESLAQLRSTLTGTAAITSFTVISQASTAEHCG